MKHILLFIALSLPSFAAYSADESAPAQCTEAIEGQVSCMANRMCECKYERGGLMTGKQPGYKWDCGITRPNCLDYNKIEEVKPYDGPNSYGLDKSTESNTTNQNQNQNANPVNNNANTNNTTQTNNN